MKKPTKGQAFALLGLGAFISSIVFISVAESFPGFAPMFMKGAFVVSVALIFVGMIGSFFD